jgi:hypothetical protein
VVKVGGVGRVGRRAGEQEVAARDQTECADHHAARPDSRKQVGAGLGGDPDHDHERQEGQPGLEGGRSEHVLEEQ